MWWFGYDGMYQYSVKLVTVVECGLLDGPLYFRWKMFIYSHG